MLNMARRSSWVAGAWIAALASIVAAGLALSAHVSTIAFLVALSLAPAIVIVLLGRSATSPSVAEILYAVEKKDGRS